MSANANKSGGDGASSIVIACPSCEYSLRGLGGPVVTCPECGTTCDIESTARQYRRTWSTTPLYERMMRVTMLSLLLVIGSPILWLGLIRGAELSMPIGLVLLGIVFGGLAAAWLYLAWRAVRNLPTTRGWTLLILLHITMAGYMVCGIGVFVGLIGLILLPVSIFNTWTDVEAVIACATFTVIGVISAVLIRPLWKVDQHIGRTCLRLSLHVLNG